MVDLEIFDELLSESGSVKRLSSHLLYREDIYRRSHHLGFQAYSYLLIGNGTYPSHRVSSDLEDLVL